MILFYLYVLACNPTLPPGDRNCVVIVSDAMSTADCRNLYLEIKATLPADMKLGFPECIRASRLKGDSHG
jgi:hypothetical protein